MEKRRVGGCRVSRARAGRTRGAETNREQSVWRFGGTKKPGLGGELGRRERLGPPVFSEH